ncbi:MAG: O-antigen ligase family protein [Roseiflexaceae bacterium]
MTIALWEVRSIYCLPMLLILTSNLIETRAHVNCLIWMIVIALFFDSLAGANFVIFDLNFNLQGLEAIAEHSYSVHLNTLFILAIGVWLFRGSRVKRIVLPLMMPIVLLSYFSNQRRASYITLAVALILIAIVLFRENRKIFWLIIPVLGVIGAIYLGAFWNSSGGIGGPARAIRSVIAPEPGGRDDSSNVYRVLENLNSKFTIKQRPLTGVGFGNKFYIVIPMPDISFFIWWEYITHNSILWLWMQSGIGGFVSMLVLVGMSVMVGVRALWRRPGGDLSAFALMATLYVVMHFIYAYVDMSWETQSMIYVGVMMGLINNMERIAARPALHTHRRWPWQAQAFSAAEIWDQS